MSITGKLHRVERDGEFWEDILKMDRDFFSRAWKTEDWISLDPAQHGLWAWVHDEKVLGFALFGTPKDDTTHLLKILLDPDHRGSGVAQIFWEKLSFELRGLQYLSVYLEVEESNSRAREFYRKLGFHHLRTAKSYYSDGESAVIMSLTL